MLAVRKSASPYLWLLVVASAALIAGRRRIVRLEIEGESMVPTYGPGDRVIALSWRRPRAGDVIALRDPRLPTRTMVKRVARAGPLGFDVRGDNAVASTDSRHFGPVPPALVRGIVVLRYGPDTNARGYA